MRRAAPARVATHAAQSSYAVEYVMACARASARACAGRGALRKVRICRASLRTVRRRTRDHLQARRQHAATRCARQPEQRRTARAPGISRGSRTPHDRRTRTIARAAERSLGLEFDASHSYAMATHCVCSARGGGEALRSVAPVPQRPGREAACRAPLDGQTKRSTRTPCVRESATHLLAGGPALLGRFNPPASSARRGGQIE